MTRSLQGPQQEPAFILKHGVIDCAFRLRQSYLSSEFTPSQNKIVLAAIRLFRLTELLIKPSTEATDPSSSNVALDD